MKQHAIKVNGVFNGIYKWGKGYESAVIAGKFKDFWKYEFPNLNPLFWKYAEPKEIGECGILCRSTGGGAIYMHPMDFTTILIASSGCSISSMGTDGKMYYNHFDNEVSELYEACVACAEYCGGSFNLNVSKEFVIDTPEWNELTDYREIEGDKFAESVGIAKE